MFGTHPAGPAPMMSRSHSDSIAVMGFEICFLLPKSVSNALNISAVFFSVVFSSAKRKDEYRNRKSGCSF